jgi:hypothetical protein
MKNSLLLILFFLASCTASQFSNQKKQESVELTTHTFEAPLTYQSVAPQFAEEEATRGLITADLLFKGIDFAFDGIKTAIKKSAENYYQVYASSLHNNSFYAKNSSLGMLDPEGIKFKGFSVTRSIALNDGREVALNACFSLDTSKLIDLYAQSKFYLICDSLSINYTKVKMNARKWYLPWTLFMKEQKHINLDLEIDILANWIDNNGQIHSQQQFGKFYFPVRNYEVPQQDTNYRGSSLGGYCYLPPRSITYCMDKRGQWKQCYGVGDFDIIAKITESSKNNKLNKVIYDNIGILEEVDAQPLKDLLNK